MEFSHRTRKKILSGNSGSYDLCIIGGGITGAGAALAAAHAGLKTLLIDKNDFASGTSSRSSKMIHGGLRYLQQMNFGLVKESLAEREILLNILPNQVVAREYVYPVYEYSKNSRFEVKLGMIGYDLLAGSKKIGHHQMWDVEDFIREEDAVNRDRLTGGFVYSDCLVDDARLTLSAIQTAVYLGVDALSYTALTEIRKEAHGYELKIRDLPGEGEHLFTAKTVINCTGPWTDEIRAAAGFGKKVLRPTKGIHLVFRRERLPLTRSVVIFGNDGRMIFTVPKGEYTYLGTTDTDHRGSADSIYADDSDVDYLLDAANKAFDRADLKRGDIISSWAGLRPLIGAEGDPSDISRDFEIIEDAPDFLSIAGGKLTTFRIMGIKIIKQLLKLNPKLKARQIDDHSGEDLSLWGGNIRNIRQYRLEMGPLYAQLWGLRESTVDRLITVYGERFVQLQAFRRQRFHYLGETDILREEILYQVRHEMALRLEDIMWRRLSILLFMDDNGMSIAEEVASLMGKELGWSRTMRRSELRSYEETVKRSYGAGLH